jgi:hypothetical protein
MNEQPKKKIVIIYRLFSHVVMVENIPFVKSNGIYTPMGEKQPNKEQWNAFFSFLHEEYNRSSESQIAVNKLLRELNIKVINYPN